MKSGISQGLQGVQPISRVGWHLSFPRAPLREGQVQCLEDPGAGAQTVLSAWGEGGDPDGEGGVDTQVHS